MPRKSKKSWQDNWAGIVLGAIIVIIIGLLVANFITNKGGVVNDGQQIDLTKREENSQVPKQYKVQANDSLSAISEKFYGDQNFWSVLAKVNKIASPNIIFVDSTLEIPTKESIKTMKDQMSQTSYQVAQGDTLFTIAEKMYGDGSKWPLIAKANRLGRLPNGNPLVFADSTIRIPR